MFWEKIVFLTMEIKGEGLAPIKSGATHLK